MADEQHASAEAGHDGAVTAATHAGTEAHGGEAHAAPAALGMDATMWVAVAMLVVIGLAIWKKIPSMISTALDKQIAGIREQLDATERLRSEAEGIKAEYEAKARQAAAEAEAMKANAEEEAKAIVAKAKADVTTLIARRTAMAEQKIAAAELAAIADVRAKAAALASAAAAALVAEHHDASVDKALVDKTIAQLN